MSRFHSANSEWWSITPASLLALISDLPCFPSSHFTLRPTFCHSPFRSRSEGDMGPKFSKMRANSATRTALDKAYRDGDTRAYREIEQSVNREKGIYTAPNDALSSTLPSPTNHAQHAAAANMNGYGYQNNYSDFGSQRSQQFPSQGMYSSGPSGLERQDRMLSGQGFTFRGSPFYHITSRIGSVHTCEGNVLSGLSSTPSD